MAQQLPLFAQRRRLAGFKAQALELAELKPLELEIGLAVGAIVQQGVAITQCLLPCGIGLRDSLGLQVESGARVEKLALRRRRQ